MPRNEVFVNADGVVEVIYHGDQTEETVRTLVSELLEKVKTLPGTIDYLIDLSDVGNSTLRSRMMVVSKLKQLRIRRQAVFGGSIFIKKLINFMMRAVRVPGVRYFETRDEAVAWLKNSRS